VLVRRTFEEEEDEEEEVLLGNFSIPLL